MHFTKRDDGAVLLDGSPDVYTQFDPSFVMESRPPFVTLEGDVITLSVDNARIAYRLIPDRLIHGLPVWRLTSYTPRKDAGTFGHPCWIDAQTTVFDELDLPPLGVVYSIYG